MQIQSFKPIIDKECNILILGSMPGVESLRKSEYYGYPRNQFWKLMFDLLGEEFSDDYNVKKKLLLKNNIALWDVIESCYREGSLDSAIKNAKPNDFAKLYSEYSGIERVFFNGAKAYDVYKRKIGFEDGKKYTKLLSTSPANAIKYHIKKDDWKKIL